MGRMGSDIWEEMGRVREKHEFKGEIWEEWALTYGKNGSSEREKKHLMSKGSDLPSARTAGTAVHTAMRSAMSATLAFGDIFL